MNIDRYMVNLFFEIKRNVPIHQQDGMKISNPNLGNVMVALNKETKDENIELLTRIFLERAGGRRIKESKSKTTRTAALIEKLSTLGNKPRTTNRTDSISQIKPKRIYRGQVVED